MKKVNRVLIITVLVLGGSCGQKSDKSTKLTFEPRETQNEQREDEDRDTTIKKITFFDLKTQLLIPHRCTQCHGWAMNEKAVRKRIISGDPENSRIYKLVKSGEMPIGSRAVPTKELELLENYINDLAK
jgi:hypothetical protein